MLSEFRSNRSRQNLLKEKLVLFLWVGVFEYGSFYGGLRQARWWSGFNVAPVHGSIYVYMRLNHFFESG
jgi:hypothetical protein